MSSNALRDSRIVAELVAEHDTETFYYAKPTTLLVDPQVYRMKEASNIRLPSQILS